MKYLFAVKSIAAGFLLGLSLTGCWFFDHECMNGDYQCNGTVIESCFTHDMVWREEVDCADYGALCVDAAEDSPAHYLNEHSRIPYRCVIPGFECADETSECLSGSGAIIECEDSDSTSVGVITEILRPQGTETQSCIDSPGEDAQLPQELWSCSTPGVFCVDETRYISCIDGIWNYIHDCDSDQLCVEEQAGQGSCRSTDTDSATDTSVDTDSDTAVDTDTATDTGGN